MKTNRWLLLGGAAVGAIALMAAACGDDDNGPSQATNTTGSGTQATATIANTATNAAQPTTAQPTATTAAASVRPLNDVLTEAINEEYKARATYQAVLDKFGAVAPFSNIITAENAHVEAWKAIFVANNLAVPADGFAGKITAPATLTAACSAGVAAETEDVALYDRLMTQTTDKATLTVMAQQRQVSQENHLPAFQRCA